MARGAAAMAKTGWTLGLGADGPSAECR